jgi:Zn-dependent peptidase ImmA (M78 family)/transcriptional regulator with XRE-family HTH domain
MRQGPVCNLEKGRNLPSATVLAKLANVLQVGTDEILFPERNAAAASSNRVSEQAPGYALRSEEREPYADDPATLSPIAPGLYPTAVIAGFYNDLPLLERIRTLAGDYLALEDLCGVPRQAAIPLRMPFDPDAASIAHLARQMRALLGVQSAVVFDYLELFEHHGLRILFVELPDTIPSLSLYDARFSNLFIFLASTLNPERQIFLLAYELARVLLYTRTTLLAPGVASGTAAARDKAARLFAANFLMPDDIVCRTIRQIGVRPDEWEFNLLLRLKHRFGVSAESFNYRLLELGLIDPERQAAFRATIKRHYDEHHHAEPGASRRILSPNGRFGDLLHTALQRNHTEAREIAGRVETMKGVCP